MSVPTFSHRVFGFTYNDNNCCLGGCRPAKKVCPVAIVPAAVHTARVCHTRPCLSNVCAPLVVCRVCAACQFQAAFWMPLEKVKGSALEGALSTKHDCCTPCCAPCPCFSDTDAEVTVSSCLAVCPVLNF